MRKYHSIDEIAGFYIIISPPLKMGEKEIPSAPLKIKAHPSRACIPIYETFEIASYFLKTSQMPYKIMTLNEFLDAKLMTKQTLSRFLFVVFDKIAMNEYTSGKLNSEDAFARHLAHIE